MFVLGRQSLSSCLFSDLSRSLLSSFLLLSSLSSSSLSSPPSPSSLLLLILLQNNVLFYFPYILPGLFFHQVWCISDWNEKKKTKRDGFVFGLLKSFGGQSRKPIAFTEQPTSFVLDLDETIFCFSR